MLMSDPLDPTAQCTQTVPPAVSSVAVANAEALPVALVSLVLLFAVAVPLDAAPNAVALNVRVATAVPGLPAGPVRRNLSFPGPPGSMLSTTRSAMALRIAVGWVTAIARAPAGWAVRSRQRCRLQDYKRATVMGA